MHQLNCSQPPTGTDELSKWVTKRCIVNEIWKKPVAHPHSIELVQAHSTSAVAMVPGGRWALLGDSGGYISAYDLDSQLPEPLPLISPEEGNIATYQPVHSLVISVDSWAPRLQFMIAFTGCWQDFFFSETITQMTLFRND